MAASWSGVCTAASASARAFQSACSISRAVMRFLVGAAAGGIHGGLGVALGAVEVGQALFGRGGSDGQTVQSGDLGVELALGAAQGGKVGQGGVAAGLADGDEKLSCLVELVLRDQVAQGAVKLVRRDDGQRLVAGGAEFLELADDLELLGLVLSKRLQERDDLFGRVGVDAGGEFVEDFGGSRRDLGVRALGGDVELCHGPVAQRPERVNGLLSRAPLGRGQIGDRVVDLLPDGGGVCRLACRGVLGTRRRGATKGDGCSQENRRGTGLPVRPKKTARMLR